MRLLSCREIAVAPGFVAGEERAGMRIGRWEVGGVPGVKIGGTGRGRGGSRGALGLDGEVKARSRFPPSLFTTFM